jgi:hypothetical protein
MIDVGNTKYNSTNSSGESKIKFGWSNHSAANIAAYKQATNLTGFKVYTELGFNTANLALTIDSSGNLIPNGNLVVANGKGIDFSATAGTGTSELFDDYEEGTWTPVFAIIGGSFSAITYNTFTGGAYTKIGNMVTVTGYITTDSLTVGTGGPLAIAGLPFAPASGTGLSTRSAVSIGSATNWASGYPISGRLQSGSTAIFLQKRSAVDGATAAVQASDMGTTSQDNELGFSAVYFT